MNKIVIALGALVFISCGNEASQNRISFDESSDKSYPTISGYSTDLRLNEISGMVRSEMHPNSFWVHNDSGDEPRIFRVNDSLEIIQEVSLQGITHLDWEDIAVAQLNGTSTLFIGDIGDNAAVRDTITIYSFEEPDLAVERIERSQIKATHLIYEDGPRDAEALLVDPTYLEWVIITKRDAVSRVYSSPISEQTNEILSFKGNLNLPERVQLTSKELNRITAADSNPKMGLVLVKNYHEIYRYTSNTTRLSNTLTELTPEVYPYTKELQGEAIALDSENWGYWTTSECADDGTKHIAQPMYYYPIGSETTGDQ